MAKQRIHFRMKQFAVADARSANKIGVDGVLLGSWAPLNSNMRRILDVGCGCGIISLMMAQRAPEAEIVGIDIEINAVEEAGENVSNSTFAERTQILMRSFEDIIEDINEGRMGRFDLIVSNPPFFESGVDPSVSERMLARHSGSLSPEILIMRARECLNPKGMLTFIAPFEFLSNYLQLANKSRLKIIKCCKVKGNPDAKAKRILLAMLSDDSRSYTCSNSDAPESDLSIDTLIIENSPGNYTPEYRELGRPFYLKF